MISNDVVPAKGGFVCLNADPGLQMIAKLCRLTFTNNTNVITIIRPRLRDDKLHDVPMRNAIPIKVLLVAPERVPVAYHVH